MKSLKIYKVKEQLFICQWYTFFCVVVLLALFSAIRFWGEGPDFYEYERLFIYHSENSLEPAYKVLKKINHFVCPKSVFFIFFFSALVAMLLKIRAFMKMTKYPIRVTIYCLLSLYLIHEYTQIRAAVAIGIFLLSISDIYSKKTGRYFFKMFLAFCFHYSAIMMLPCWIYIHLSKKNIYYVLFPVIGFIIALAFGQNKELMKIIYFVEESLGFNKSGNISDYIKPYNLKYLISLFTLFLIYKLLPKNNIKDTYLFRIYSFGLSCFYFILPAQLPVMAVRFAEFYTPALFVVFTNCIYNQHNKFKRFFYLTYFHGYILLYLYASFNTTLL